MDTTPSFTDQQGHSRILLVGDLHANKQAATAAIDLAADRRADLILQVGDFGYWPEDGFGRTFLNQVEAHLAMTGLDLWWIDGNHEDFDSLRDVPAEPDGTRRISDHVRWLPRGHRLSWGGNTWLMMGGAISVDQHLRTEGRDWFAEEAVTDAQVIAAIEAGPADVVVAHDAPWGGGPLSERLEQHLAPERRRSTYPTSLLAASDQHQKRLRWLADEVQPLAWFHGHHHWRYNTMLGDCRVQGLGRDGDSLDDLCLLVDAAGVPILDLDGPA